MTYPPGNPGYPPQPQPNQYNAPNGGPNQPYGRVPERIPAAPAAPAAPAGPSNLPLYLTAAVAVLGLVVFGFSFADPFGLKSSDSAGPIGSVPRDILTWLPAIAAVVAGLLAGIDLLPKQKNLKAWTALLAVLGLLLAIAELTQLPQVPPMLKGHVDIDFEVKWGLYCVIGFSVLQAGCALAALLLDAGVIQPPAPKPQTDPYGYGGPGQYYGQSPVGGPQHNAPQHNAQHNAPQGRPDYGQQYGQPGGYQQPGSPAGGYPGGRPQHSSADDSSPVTPATGFSAFGQAPSAGGPPTTGPESGSAYPGVPGASAPSSEATQTFQQQQAPQQSDPTSS
jgi:hypothetical protein